MVSCWKHNNGPYNSIKCVDFFWIAEWLLASEAGFNFMELNHSVPSKNCMVSQEVVCVIYKRIFENDLSWRYHLCLTSFINMKPFLWKTIRTSTGFAGNRKFVRNFDPSLYLLHIVKIFIKCYQQSKVIKSTGKFFNLRLHQSLSSFGVTQLVIRHICMGLRSCSRPHDSKWHVICLTSQHIIESVLCGDFTSDWDSKFNFE